MSLISKFNGNKGSIGGPCILFSHLTCRLINVSGDGDPEPRTTLQTRDCICLHIAVPPFCCIHQSAFQEMAHLWPWKVLNTFSSMSVVTAPRKNISYVNRLSSTKKYDLWPEILFKLLSNYKKINIFVIIRELLIFYCFLCQVT